MQDGGRSIRRRLKSEIGKSISAEQYACWHKAKVAKGRLNKASTIATRKAVIDTEQRLRGELLQKMPIVVQVATFMHGTMDIAEGIADEMKDQTTMPGYPNKGHPGKGTDGSQHIFHFKTLKFLV